MTGAVHSDGFGPVIALPLSRVQQVSGRRLHAAWTQIPHVTHHEEADVTALDALRAASGGEAGQRVSLLACVARACAAVLRQFPKFNAALDAEGKAVLLKQYLNLGFAIDTPQGLIVAVAHDAWDADVAALAATIRDLAARGREGRLKPTEMEGAGFTISSLGTLGGTGFTPIINPPNVAILGLAQARIRPQWRDAAVVPRLMLPLSLSYDHRVIDGAEAARFCAALAATLADPPALGMG